MIRSIPAFSLLAFLLAALPLSAQQGEKKDAKPELKKNAELDKLINDLKAKDVKTRIKAANDLNAMGEDAATATPALCQALLDVSPKVQEAALVAIEKVRPDLYKPLSQIVLDKSRYRNATLQAVIALGKMREKASPTVPIILLLLKQEAANLRNHRDFTVDITTQLFIECMSALSSIEAKDDETIKTISNLAGPTFKGSFVRVAALEEFKRFTSDNEKLKKQYYLLCKGALDDCSTMAIYLLGELRADAKDALPILKKLKLSNDEAIRDAANNAVNKIENPTVAESDPKSKAKATADPEPKASDGKPAKAAFDPNDPRRTLEWYVSFKPKDTGNELVDKREEQQKQHLAQIFGKKVRWQLTVTNVWKDGTISLDRVGWPVKDLNSWRDKPAEDIRDTYEFQFFPVNPKRLRASEQEKFSRSFLASDPTIPPKLVRGSKVILTGTINEIEPAMGPSIITVNESKQKFAHGFYVYITGTISLPADPTAKDKLVPPKATDKLDPAEQKATFLSDMKEYDVNVSDNRWAKKGNLGYRAGNPQSGRILVNGKESPNGLSMCAIANSYSTVKYSLDKSAHKFLATAALNDSAGGTGFPLGVGKIPTVLIFEVLGDSKSLWKSKPIDSARSPQECEIDVTGVKVLEAACQLSRDARQRPSRLG